MVLERILEHNGSFVRGREPKPLPAPEAVRLGVVACCDPRLDGLIGPALGINPTEAIVVRVAGALVRPDGDPLRSLALGIFMFDLRELLVLGHTSCRMAQFQNPSFIDAFRARGVAREAFGASDLREWAGAFSDPKRGVQSSVAALAAAQFVPKDVLIAGLLLDDTTGALEVVVSSVAAGARPVSSSPEPAENHGAAPPSEPVEPPAPLPAAMATMPDLSNEIGAVREFVGALESAAAWRGELERLRAELARQRNPVARYALVERFVRAAAADSREILGSIERLKAAALAARGEFDAEALVRLFQRGSGRRGQ